MQSVLYHIIYEVRKPTKATSLSIQIYYQPFEGVHSPAERFHLPMYTNKCFLTHRNCHYVA